MRTKTRKVTKGARPPMIPTKKDVAQRRRLKRVDNFNSLTRRPCRISVTFGVKPRIFTALGDVSTVAFRISANRDLLSSNQELKW
jgi:hypothetical protein